MGDTLTLDVLEIDEACLPDSVPELKQLVIQLLKQCREDRAALISLQAKYSEVLMQLYGKKSERSHPDQKLLFDSHDDSHDPSDEQASPEAQLPETQLPETQAPEAPEAKSEADTTDPNGHVVPEASASAQSENAQPTPSPESSAKNPKRDRHGRRRFSELPVKRTVVHDLSDVEKQLLGGAENLKLIGTRVTKQVDYEPRTLHVVEHVQNVYARIDPLPESGLTFAEQNVVTSPKPPQLIPGCLAGPGLLAEVIVSKASDHIPHHRFESITKRAGVKFSRQTTNDWWLRLAQGFMPIYLLMSMRIRQSQVIHVDGTRGPIRDSHGRTEHVGCFWPYIGDWRHRLVVFDYTLSESQAGPKAFLQDYRGYVQADAGSAFNGLFNDPASLRVEVGCWMHARRRFFKAQKLGDKRAEPAIARIARLYAIEAEITEKLPDWSKLPREDLERAIADYRQIHSLPVLEAHRAWCEAEVVQLKPTELLANAIRYGLNHWEALVRYTTDGKLVIDNGAAERVIRPLAIGRRNWLFNGNEASAKLAAVHFSLVASCRLNEIEPWEYLRNLIVELPKLGEKPNNEALTPLLPCKPITS
jgi:transposase